MKRILIDGRFIGVGESISRYTLEIVQGILELDKENEYTLLVRPQAKSQIVNRKLQNYGNLTIKTLDIPHYSIQEQTKLLDYLNQEKFDLVHFTQFNHPIRYKGKYVICIHDLTLLGHLYRMNFLKRWGFRKVMKSAAHDSVKIITISNTTKKDLIDTYGVDPGKIAVTYLAVDQKYNSNLKSHPSRLGGQAEVETSNLINFRNKYKLSENYILYTGMWKRHKNILRMLDAFLKYKSQIINHKSQTDIQLVLVGKIDKEEPEVMALINQINQRMSKSEFLISNKVANDLNPNDKNLLDDSPDDLKMPGSRPERRDSHLKAIVATGFIDEEELPIAYAAATAYIIPSLSEGFGLPPLEAMACGTPVLSSNISAMPEILGKAPFYFDPYDTEDMSMAMKTVVEDKELQKELSEKGLEWVKRYDWKKTAKETLDVYKSVLHVS